MLSITLFLKTMPQIWYSIYRRSPESIYRQLRKKLGMLVLAVIWGASGLDMTKLVISSTRIHLTPASTSFHICLTVKYKVMQKLFCKIKQIIIKCSFNRVAKYKNMWPICETRKIITNFNSLLKTFNVTIKHVF